MKCEAAAGVVDNGVRCGTQLEPASSSVPRARTVELLVAVLNRNGCCFKLEFREELKRNENCHPILMGFDFK